MAPMLDRRASLITDTKSYYTSKYDNRKISWLQGTSFSQSYKRNGGSYHDYYAVPQMVKNSGGNYYMLWMVVEGPLAETPQEGLRIHRPKLNASRVGPSRIANLKLSFNFKLQCSVETLTVWRVRSVFVELENHHHLCYVLLGH